MSYQKKNHIINVPVSTEEKVKIKEKAGKVGMSIAGFMRFLALKSSLPSIKNIEI